MSPTRLVACQCGAISFRLSQPEPIDIYACHCLECRKQSASAFGVSAIYPVESIWPLLEPLRPQLGLWTRPTDSGNTLECYFCKTCGVRILHWSVFPDGTRKPTVSVKGGCIEDLSLKEAKHIFVRSALVPVPEGSEPASPRIRPGMRVESGTEK